MNEDDVPRLDLTERELVVSIEAAISRWLWMADSSELQRISKR